MAGPIALERLPLPDRESTFGLASFGLSDTDAAAGRRRRVALPASMLLHGAAALALVLVPLLLADSLPTSSGELRAFFVEPIALPAPPPPPPAPPRGATAAHVAPRPTTSAAAVFSVPVEVPAEIRPEEGLEIGVEGGVPGGVEGGVPGGVVGGGVGGLPDAPPPPTVKPVRVGGAVREPRKLVHVAPVYPEAARQARLQGVVVIEATLDARGHVANATVLHGNPIFDDSALEAVRQWVYMPTLLNGIPTPVLMTVTLVFRLRDPDL